MNEEAQKILMDLLKKATNGIDSAVAFSQQQIPDVIHQLLMWNAISSVLLQIFAVSLVLLSLYARRVARRSKAEGEKWTAFDGRPRDAWFVSSFSYDFLNVIFPFIALAVGVILFFTNFTWLKIWLAPKLYLIEYAASLVK